MGEGKDKHVKTEKKEVEEKIEKVLEEMKRRKSKNRKKNRGWWDEKCETIKIEVNKLRERRRGEGREKHTKEKRNNTTNCATERRKRMRDGKENGEDKEGK